MKAAIAALCGAVLLASSAIADHSSELQATLTLCGSCHGPTALEATKGPALEGQKIDYLRKQLFDFRSGARVDPNMTPQAKALTEAQIEQLVAHYAALPGPTSSKPPAIDPTTRPLVYCVRCHGATGVSPNELWPNLAGLEMDYMRKQIDAFASGARRDDMMANWGRMLDEKELERILRYFSEQK